MKKSFLQAGNWIHSQKKEIFVVFFFLFVAFTAMIYSRSLLFFVHPDNYVSLLANKASANVNYPDRDMIMRMDFKPYLYTNALDFFSSRFSIPTYESIMLFLMVFLAGYGAFLALRLLGFSYLISIGTSMIFLMPRYGLGSSPFGVFTRSELLGRSFALPILWLLSAWFIKRKFERKSLWPIFAIAGLATYVHPVSMIFFSGLLFLIFLSFILSDKNYREGLKDFGISIFCFCVASSFLLLKIFSTSKYIGTVKSNSIVATGKDYADALLYRMAFDFPPGNLIWLRNTAIVSCLFIFTALYIYFQIRKGTILKESMTYLICKFSALLIFLSIFLSLAIPSAQMWMIVHRDWPLLVQQTSRFFNTYFLGLFLLFPIFLTFVSERFSLRNRSIIFLIILGMASSSFCLEWFEFLVGYKGYSPLMIPKDLQTETSGKGIDDETKIDPPICRQVASAGVSRSDLILVDDFSLRYNCELHILLTYVEGTAYMMSGKNELVWWYRTKLEQDKALAGSADDLINFAKKEKARYALITPNTAQEKEFELKKMVVSKGDTYSLIKF